MHNSELPYIYQFSCSLVSNPLWTHGLQLAWLFVHYQIHVNQVGGAIQPSQSSVTPFSSHLQSFLSSGSFSMTRFLASSSQSVGASASALLLLMNIQDWFPLEFIGLISLQSKGQAKVFSNTTVQNHWLFSALPSLRSNYPPYLTTGNSKLLTIRTFVGKVMSLLFNILSRLVIAFLPRSKHLLISWLQSTSAVILETKKIKPATVSIVSPSVCHKVMKRDAMILAFWILSFKSTFSLSSFTFINSFFTSSSFSAIGWCHLHIWGYCYFSRQSWFQLVLHPAWHFPWCTLHRS